MKVRYKVGDVICYRTGKSSANTRKIVAVKENIFSVTYAVEGMLNSNDLVKQRDIIGMIIKQK